MTEKGTTSPISERSNISQMGQSRIIATDHADHPGQADQLEKPQSGHSLATAVEPAATGQSTTGQPTTGYPTTGVRDQVTVRMPADGAYLSVLRTATAGLAARLDFTLDEIEDMRIAVDEACAMVLGQAIPGSGLECRFSLGQDAMTIAVSVHALTPRAPT